MTEWISKNKRSIIRAAFLVPIFAVAAISISHVVSWYDLANPISWAIYLSVAVEVAAMSAIAASSVRVKGFSVWFVFIIVTLIQFIGNIFFCYSEIDISSKAFADWAELTSPLLEAAGSDLKDVVAQRRWLALLEGGLLPLISLTCLHFFIQYGEQEEAADLTPSSPQKKEATVEPEEVEPTENLLNIQPPYSKAAKKVEPPVEVQSVSAPDAAAKPKVEPPKPEINKQSGSEILSEKMKKIKRRWRV
jgi:hypothetical protein